MSQDRVRKVEMMERMSMPKENFLYFFISAIPGEPAPAGTDEPGQGEEGGDDVEDEHAKCHYENGEVELVGNAGTLKVHAMHITVHGLNIKNNTHIQDYSVVLSKNT
jgi:hypothetical protein